MLACNQNGVMGSLVVDEGGGNLACLRKGTIDRVG